MKLKLSWRRLIKIFILAFTFLGLFKPDSLEYLNLKWLDSFLMLWDVFVLIYLLLALAIGKYKMTGTTICVIAIYISYAFSTIRMSQDYMTFIKTAGPITAICLLVDYSMQNNPEEYLDAIVFLLNTLFTMNFISILLYYPEGMYDLSYIVGDIYLLGFDNGMIYTLVPLVGYSCIRSCKKRGRIISFDSIYSISIMLASVFYVRAGSGMVQALLFVFMVMLITGSSGRKIINPVVAFGTFYLATYLIVVRRITSHLQPLFDVLGKDSTFSGRTYMWNNALLSINEHFTLGIGATARTVLGKNGLLYPHPHCLLLDFLYRGGIVMFALFTVLLIRFSSVYYKKSGVVKSLILISVFAILIGEVVNSAQYKVFFWSMFPLIEYTEMLENKKIERQGLQ
ncbi:MAG: O-antigen ligase family protein [Lachnospiraceae bacterium]|nr:O-antigen ligase family protein [Lachnospiraceae bacterium]